jgi:fructose-1,6-bisphosphatase/inositol monophosphatase family enzyme
MHPSDLSSRLELTRRIAVEAGELTLRYFQRADLAVETKHDSSPVTVADRQAEQLLRQRISEAFPADAILGEEFGEQPGTSGFRWILDPIDGTKSFIHGVPLYGTLIGIEYERRSVVGMIHIPALKESVYAATGLGAWYVAGQEPPRLARVGSATKVSSSLL